MKVDIFTEGSSTLQEEPESDSVKDYFGGGFLSVTSLADDLAEYADAEIHVLSEELGFVKGSDEVPEWAGEELSMEDFVREKDEFRKQMRESAAGSDAIVLMFTKDSFRTLVASQWSQLVEAAQSETVWCISTSRTAFDTVELDSLQEKKVELVKYERVGVARIGNETREELLEMLNG